MCLNPQRRFWKGTKRAPTARKRKFHSTFPTPATRTFCTAPPPLTSEPLFCSNDAHCRYLGSESGAWGDEVKQRVEAEEFFSAKFKAPIVYVVLGGGTVTVNLVQECIQKEAFTVVVKGSGRAADVIAEYAAPPALPAVFFCDNLTQVCEEPLHPRGGARGQPAVLGAARGRNQREEGGYTHTHARARAHACTHTHTHTPHPPTHRVARVTSRRLRDTPPRSKMRSTCATAGTGCKSAWPSTSA